MPDGATDARIGGEVVICGPAFPFEPEAGGNQGMINETILEERLARLEVLEELEPAGRVAPGDADPVRAGRGGVPDQPDPFRSRTRHRRDRGDRPFPPGDAGGPRRDGLAALLSAVLGCRGQFPQPAIGPQPLPLPPLPRGLRGYPRRLYRRDLHGRASGAAHPLSRSGVAAARGLYFHLPRDARWIDGRRAPP